MGFLKLFNRGPSEAEVRELAVQLDQSFHLAEFMRLTGEEGPIAVRRRFVESVLPGRGSWTGGTVIDLGNGRRVKVRERPETVFALLMEESP